MWLIHILPTKKFTYR